MPTPTTVTARRRLRATPEQLFAVLADSARLSEVRGVARVEVLAVGAEGPLSAGTTRRVRLIGGGSLVEEFVRLAGPHEFDYRLQRTTIPVDHRSGRITFREADGATEASWSSTYVVAVPGAARPLTLASRPLVRAAFHLALGALDERATRTAGGRDA